MRTGTGGLPVRSSRSIQYSIILAVFSFPVLSWRVFCADSCRRLRGESIARVSSTAQRVRLTASSLTPNSTLHIAHPVLFRLLTMAGNGSHRAALSRNGFVVPPLRQIRRNQARIMLDLCLWGMHRRSDGRLADGIACLRLGRLSGRARAFSNPYDHRQCGTNCSLRPVTPVPPIRGLRHRFTRAYRPQTMARPNDSSNRPISRLARSRNNLLTLHD